MRLRIAICLFVVVLVAALLMASNNSRKGVDPTSGTEWIKCAANDTAYWEVPLSGVSKFKNMRGEIWAQVQIDTTGGVVPNPTYPHVSFFVQTGIKTRSATKSMAKGAINWNQPMQILSMASDSLAWGKGTGSMDITQLQAETYGIGGHWREGIHYWDVLRFGAVSDADNVFKFGLDLSIQ